MKKAMIALSGGVDSTTVLAWLLANDYDVNCIKFVYGSKHNSYELQCADEVLDYYTCLYPSIKRTTVDMTGVFSKFNSALMSTDKRNVPEGYYTNENMSQTVVPARNIIFLSVLAGLAQSEEAGVVALGTHQGDHAIYADCRTEFHKAMDAALFLGTDKQVEIVAPFINCDKQQIVKYGLDYSVPYKYTRTCYKNQPQPCGHCGACQERLEAFMKNDEVDPVTYENE